MDFSKKTQVDFGLDSEGKKWVMLKMRFKTSLNAWSTIGGCDLPERIAISLYAIVFALSAFARPESVNRGRKSRPELYVRRNRILAARNVSS